MINEKSSSRFPRCPPCSQHSQGLPTVHGTYYRIYTTYNHSILPIFLKFIDSIGIELNFVEHNERPNQMSDPRDVYEPLWVMRKMNEF